MKSNITKIIKKLLALATSNNEHEAKAAAEKAQELLVKHNLKMSELPAEEINFKNEIGHSGRRLVEDKFVNAILLKHFFIVIVKSKGEIRFIGEESNLEIAHYMRDFLRTTFKNLFKQYQKETGCPANHRQSYYFGLYKGLDEKLTIKRSHVETSMEMVVVPNNALNRFVSSEFGRLSEGRNASFSNRSSEAQSNGKSAGQNIQLRKGVTENQGNRRALLG